LTADEIRFKKVFYPLAIPAITVGESLWSVIFSPFLRADPAGFILLALSGPRNIL
jgi:hypothetical protein